MSHARNMLHRCAMYGRVSHGRRTTARLSCAHVLMFVSGVFVACTPSPTPNSHPGVVASSTTDGLPGGDVVDSSGARRSPNPVEPREKASSSALISARFEAAFTTADGFRRQGALLRGAELRTGDYLWINIDVIRESHIYVLQLDREGRPELLFPSALERDVARPARSSLRVPPLPEVFTLDENVGKEHLVVIASLAPVTATDADLRKVLEEAQAHSNVDGETIDHVAPPPASSPAPNATRTRETPRPVSPTNGYLSRVADRGILRVNPSAAIEAQEASDGIAVIRFDFEHR